MRNRTDDSAAQSGSSSAGEVDTGLVLPPAPSENAMHASPGRRLLKRISGQFRRVVSGGASDDEAAASSLGESHSVRSDGSSDDDDPHALYSSVSLAFDRARVTRLAVLAQGPASSVLRVAVGPVQLACKEFATRYMPAGERDVLIASFKRARLLKHAHVVDHVGFDIAQTNLMLFTELMDTTLRHELTERAAAGAERAFGDAALLDMATQIASAVDFLHARDVLHRDIKAENVLVLRVLDDARPLVLKLGDLGESVHLPRGQDKLLDTNVGSIGFMAPEVVALNKTHARSAYGFKADIFSFGVTLFEMLAPTETPYGDIPHFDLPRRIRAGERPSWPKDVDTWVWKGAKAVLRSAFFDSTAVEPDDRPDAAELLERFERAGEQQKPTSENKDASEQ